MRCFFVFLLFCNVVLVHGDKNRSVEANVVHTLGEVYRLSAWHNGFFQDMRGDGGCMNVLCLNYLITNLNSTNPYTLMIPLYSSMDQGQYEVHYKDMTDGVGTLHSTMSLLHTRGLLTATDDVTGQLSQVLGCVVNVSSYSCYLEEEQLLDLTDLCEKIGPNCTNTADDLYEERSNGSAEVLLPKFLWSPDPDGISQLLSKLHSKEISYKTERIYRLLHENKYYTSVETAAELSPVLSADFSVFIKDLIKAFPKVIPEVQQTGIDLNKEAVALSKVYKKHILDIMKVVYKVTSWYLEKGPSKEVLDQLSRSILHLQLQLNLLFNHLKDFINSPGSSSQSYIINEFFNPTATSEADEGLDDERGIKIINFKIDHLQDQLPSELKLALWEFLSMVWGASYNKGNNVDVEDILTDMVGSNKEFLIIVFKSLKSLNELNTVLETEHGCSLLRTGATLKIFLNSPINSTGALDICNQFPTSTSTMSSTFEKLELEEREMLEADTDPEDIVEYIPRDKKEEFNRHQKSGPNVTSNESSKHRPKVDINILNEKLINERGNEPMKNWRKKLITQGNGGVEDDTSFESSPDASINETSHIHTTTMEPPFASSSTAPNTTFGTSLEEEEKVIEVVTKETVDVKDKTTVIDGASGDNTTQPELGAPSKEEEEEEGFGDHATAIFGCTAGLAALLLISSCIYRRHKRNKHRRGYMSGALRSSLSGENVYRTNIPEL